MFLRSISIRGFKSFANKSVIRLEPGVTTIVGPNGSGKSNIVDAVLWVLGEQKPKSLRGSTMQDIIFSGSNAKQSLGVAEVTLRLDNNDGAIPIEYNEVTITRRSYRSGENEYLLNNSPCRLLDIQELLSDSGLGREMYSVISQGKLNNILNCKPEERRQLIEGTAGVLKHKERKKRALRKLISTDKNITRINDILSEINTQIDPLKKQADTAVVYNRLNKELEKNELVLNVNQLRAYQKTWDNLKDKMVELDDNISDIKDKLNLEKEKISVCESKLEARLLIAGDVGEKRRKFTGVSEKAKSGLLLLREKKRNLSERLSRLSRSLTELDKKEKIKLAEQKRNDNDIKESENNLAVLEKKLARAENETEDLKKAGQLEAKEYDDRYWNLKSYLDKIKDKREVLSKEKSVISVGGEEIKFLTEQLDKIDTRLKIIDSDRVATKASIMGLKSEWTPITKEIAKRQIKIDGLTDIVESKQKELDTLTVKSDSLSAKIDALKGVANDLREPIDTKKKLLSNNKFSDIIGPLFELIKVKPEYETAIETALSRDIYALVAKDVAAAREVIKALRDHSDEFISMVLAGFNNDKISVNLDITWATPAMTVVECSPEVHGAVNALLGNIYIVDSLSILLDNIDKSPPKCSFVTLNGDILTDRGVIRHGVFSRKKLGLISCLRETADLEKEQITVKRALVKTSNVLDESRFNLKKEQNYVLKLSTGAQENEAALAERELVCRHFSEEQRDLESQKKDLQGRISKKVTTIEKQNSDTLAQSVNIDKDEGSVKNLEEELKILKGKVEKSRLDEREAITKLGTLQVELASLTERRLHFQQNASLLADEVEGNKKSRALNEREKIDLENILRLLAPIELIYNEMLKSAQNRLTFIANLTEKETVESREIRDRLNKAQNDIDIMREKIESYQETKRDAQVKQARLEIRVQETTDYLVNELNVPLKIALKEDDDGQNIGELKIVVNKIKSELKGLGLVNQRALAEYQRLNERRLFLDKQIDDLRAGRAALKKVITAIEEKITERFLLTLAKVNENFTNVFSQLFPGGQGQLILTEADGDGEAGIEIEARPRGKTLQSLNLLSGGEKALVGLALLFAFFYTRPSPFYILDEVEAALDDVNIQRFIALIGQLKNSAQFLVITHQRRTMEIADSLYGVSMQADGVSKLVSQKIDEGENVTEAEPKITRAAEIRPS